MRVSLFSALALIACLSCFNKARFLVGQLWSKGDSHHAGDGSHAYAQTTSAQGQPAAAQSGSSSSDNTDQGPNTQNLLDQQISCTYNGGISFLGHTFSSQDIKLLFELAKRRQQLDKYQQQLLLKESVIKGIETKLQEKIAELKVVQTQVDASLKEQHNKEEERLKSLVKIYENMKPQDAAKIFDDMDDISAAVSIIRLMKEQKVAPILANMSVNKARDISLALFSHKDSKP